MKKYLLQTILITTDFILLSALFYFAIYIRENLDVSIIPVFKHITFFDFSFVPVILFALLYREKIYTFRYDFWQETLKIINSFFIGFILVLAVLALTKSNLEYSRLFIVIYFIIGLLLFPIGKRYIKKIIYFFPYFKEKVLIVGDESQVEVFKQEFKDNWYLGQKYAAFDYDSVTIISKGLSTDKLNELITKYLSTNYKLYIVPYVTDINFAHSNIMEYSNIRQNTIQIENKLLIKRNLWIKNIFDKVAVFIMIPFLLIIHTIISVMILLDSRGPIFFRQNRLGKNNKNFKCFKYRTMHENSNKLLEKYLKHNPDEVEYYDKFHKYKNDPRITKVGKLLRSTSLDELPQILNVFKAEMSLVGPRPYMLGESKKLGDNQEFILKVNPGITGLWQVSGRNELTFLQRNELEVWYIKNWSLWTDFVILIKTVKVVISKIGAR